MISLDKCNGSCNTVDDLSTKACVPSKTKDVNVKVFNMITNRNKAKALVIKHISCNCKCKFNGTTCNSNQKWGNETCQCECENYHKWKKDNSSNPSKCISENDKYLKSIVDDSKIVCDLHVIIMQNIDLNKKVHCCTKNMKTENNDFERVSIKNRTCYYFHDITKIKDFDFDNVLINSKLYENILTYNISYKTLTGSKPLRIRFDKVSGFIRVYDGNKYLTFFGTEKYNVIYNRIIYHIGIKSGIKYVISGNYARINADSYHFLTLHNAITHMKSVLNKDQNHYYYDILLLCLY